MHGHFHGSRLTKAVINNLFLLEAFKPFEAEKESYIWSKILEEEPSLLVLLDLKALHI